MTKKEFLDNLQFALTGHVSHDVIRENVDYYETYISMQMRKGRSEQEVLEELGSPRLLAKTIIASRKYTGEQEKETTGEESTQPSGFMEKLRNLAFHMPGWLILILVVLVPILCMTVLSAIVSFILAIIGPVLIPLLCIWLLITIFSKRK